MIELQTLAFAVESTYDGETKQLDLFKTEETAARIAFSHGGVVTALVRKSDALAYAASQMREHEARVRAEAIRKAATCAVIHSMYPIENDFERGYDKGRKDAAEAIRRSLSQGDGAISKGERAMADQHPPQARDAFEAWFREHYHDRLSRNMPDKSYNDPSAYSKWDAWLAALEWSRRQPAGAENDPCTLKFGATRDGIRCSRGVLGCIEPHRPGGPILGYATHHDEPMLFPTKEEARQYCEDDEEPIPLVAAVPVKEGK